MSLAILAPPAFVTVADLLDSLGNVPPKKQSGAAAARNGHGRRRHRHPCQGPASFHARWTDASVLPSGADGTWLYLLPTALPGGVDDVGRAFQPDADPIGLGGVGLESPTYADRTQRVGGGLESPTDSDGSNRVGLESPTYVSLRSTR